MTYRRKTDANHMTIINGLRSIGASVFSTHRVGKGFPDAVCGFRGENYLLEIKTPEGDLTRDEIKFFDEWAGQVHVVITIDDALEVIGAIPKTVNKESGIDTRSEGCRNTERNP